MNIVLKGVKVVCKTNGFSYMETPASMGKLSSASIPNKNKENKSL